MTRARTALPALGLALAFVLVGCVPEPAVTSSASAVASDPPVAGQTPSTPASAQPGAFEIPPDCSALYSTEMLATLNQQVPPLNDPAVSLFSTQNATALELLDSGIPTVRCSWGSPGGAGLATNVSILDAAQAQTLQDALAAEGIACEAADGGILCAAERQTINLDDELVTTGEQHLFRDGGWVSTAYVDALPDGYTRDIADTLWG